MQEKPIYWFNYGIGGATNNYVPAENASQAAEYPYWTIESNLSSPSADPWTNPAVRGFEQYFYNMTIQYAQESAVSLLAISFSLI